jgi:DNA polymerase I-like protein with 3'-5' exonuclease and polymerase domains
MDIARACEAVRHLNPPQIHGEADVRANIQVFRGNDQYDLLLELLGVAKSAKVKAIDLETRGLRPYSAGAGIMSAAVSFNDKFNFGFAIDHPQALWTPEQKLTILSRFADLIRDDTTKVAHNAPFELEWLAWRYGTEIINHTAWECTMMQAHFLDERKGQQWDETVRASKYQSLDFLVKQHFGLSFKQLFNTNKKDMSKTDLTELLTYNAADTKYTLRLYHLQKQALGTNGDRAAYKLAVLQQPTVALMQHIGVPVHQRAIKVAQQKLGEDIEAIEYNIQDLGVVKEFAADHKGGFNPASTRDVAEIFDEYLHCPQVRVTSEHARVYNFDGQSTPKHNAHKSMKEDTVGKVRISVDKHVLEKIDHPLAKLMLRWRNKTKLKSTYVDGLPIYPDGNLHTNFNTTGTETGRLSSDEPNLQNFPKRNDAWVRSAIIPPRGSVMVAIDYGQLEACTGAMCSNDLYLCKALWDDYDIHMDWAKLIDKTKPELRNGLEMKKFRSLIKNKFVFPAFYGASAKSIAMYLKDAFGCDVDEAMVDGIMDKFWGVLSGMKRWQDNLVKQYYETGYVTTLGGRKHRYPLNVNQVINHPFQGTAAELVSDAMVRLSYLAAQTGQWFLHPILNIHDDLSFFVPEKGLYKALETIMKEMLIFDFPWVNVPLSLEVSVGPNWYDLKPLGKYWSHREFGYPAPTRKF